MKIEFDITDDMIRDAVEKQLQQLVAAAVRKHVEDRWNGHGWNSQLKESVQRHAKEYIEQRVIGMLDQREAVDAEVRNAMRKQAEAKLKALMKEAATA